MTVAETQEFETDFWKDAQLRKVWDEIVPGEPRKTLSYTLTLEAIQKYCRIVGDFAQQGAKPGTMSQPEFVRFVDAESHPLERGDHGREGNVGLMS